jgi:hypothetical protein
MSKKSITELIPTMMHFNNAAWNPLPGKLGTKGFPDFGPGQPKLKHTQIQRLKTYIKMDL